MPKLPHGTSVPAARRKALARPRSRGAPGGAAGEDAAAEERALQRAVAVHAAAAEARHLAGRVQVAERLRRRPAARAPTRSVSSPPSVLRVRIVQPDRDQRPGRRVEDAVRLGHADQLVAEVVAGAADGRDLRVLGEGVVDLAVARRDLALAARPRRAAASPVSVFMPRDQLGQRRRATMKSAPCSMNASHRRRRAAAAPRASTLSQLPAGEVRVLLGARQRELAAR